MRTVLILVLMEYALLRVKSMTKSQVEACLNPCSNGICSLTYQILRGVKKLEFVLILVLMEYALLH